MPEDWVNVFDLQREAERELEPGPRGCFSGGATAAERGPERLRSARRTRVYSEAEVSGSSF